MVNRLLVTLWLLSEVTVGFSPRIVGGSIAPPTAYPWMASLQFFQTHLCGGSLIHDSVILTAAHCVSPTGFPIERVVLNQHKLYAPASPERQVRYVKSILMHEQYVRSTGRNDIALIFLSEPVHNIRSVSVSGEDVSPGTMAKAVGYGALFEGSWYDSEFLREVSIPIVSVETCQKAYEGALTTGQITQNNICAGYPDGGKDACQGDSGGPLVVEKDTQQVQVGLVSWGEGCARPNRYGVYTRVSSYVTWIRNNIIEQLGSDVGFKIFTNGGGRPTFSPTPGWVEALEKSQAKCRRFKRARYCSRVDSCFWKKQTCNTKLMNMAGYTWAPTRQPTSAPSRSPTAFPTKSPVTMYISEHFRCRRKNRKRCMIDDRCYWRRRKCNTRLALLPGRTWSPTFSPTVAPSVQPTISPSVTPTSAPTSAPISAATAVAENRFCKAFRRKSVCRRKSDRCFWERRKCKSIVFKKWKQT